VRSNRILIPNAEEPTSHLFTERVVRNSDCNLEQAIGAILLTRAYSVSSVSIPFAYPSKGDQRYQNGF